MKAKIRMTDLHGFEICFGNCVSKKIILSFSYGTKFLERVGRRMGDSSFQRLKHLKIIT